MQLRNLKRSKIVLLNYLDIDFLLTWDNFDSVEFVNWAKWVVY